MVRLAQTADWARSTPLDAVVLEHREVLDPEHDLGSTVTELAHATDERVRSDDVLVLARVIGEFCQPAHRST